MTIAIKWGARKSVSSQVQSLIQHPMQVSSWDTATLWALLEAFVLSTTASRLCSCQLWLYLVTEIGHHRMAVCLPLLTKKAVDLHQKVRKLTLGLYRRLCNLPSLHSPSWRSCLCYEQDHGQATNSLCDHELCSYRGHNHCSPDWRKASSKQRAFHFCGFRKFDFMAHWLDFYAGLAEPYLDDR